MINSNHTYDYKFSQSSLEEAKEAAHEEPEQVHEEEVDIDEEDTEDYGAESAEFEDECEDDVSDEGKGSSRSKGARNHPRFIDNHITKGYWTKEEDLLLCDAVGRNAGKNWKKIAESLTGRTEVQCLHRW